LRHSNQFFSNNNNNNNNNNNVKWQKSLDNPGLGSAYSVYKKEPL